MTRGRWDPESFEAHLASRGKKVVEGVVVEIKQRRVGLSSRAAAEAEIQKPTAWRHCDEPDCKEMHLATAPDPSRRAGKLGVEKRKAAKPSAEDDLGYLLDQEWPGEWARQVRFDRGRRCLQCGGSGFVEVPTGSWRGPASLRCKPCKGAGATGRRLFRFDFAWVARRLAVEVDGGIWTKGRHTRGEGWEADAEKLAEAAIQGWVVIRVSTGQVADGRAMGWIRRLVNAREV